MNREKAAQLLAMGVKLGLRRDDILRFREWNASGKPLTAFLKDYFSRDEQAFFQATRLLTSAFDLSIGDVKPIYLWNGGGMTDSEFEEHLQGLVRASNQPAADG